MVVINFYKAPAPAPGDWDSQQGGDKPWRNEWEGGHTAEGQVQAVAAETAALKLFSPHSGLIRVS